MSSYRLHELEDLGSLIGKIIVQSHRTRVNKINQRSYPRLIKLERELKAKEGDKDYYSFEAIVIEERAKIRREKDIEIEKSRKMAIRQASFMAKLLLYGMIGLVLYVRFF